MSTFDPAQHPRGNQSTGHTGQFATKAQTSAEVGLTPAKAAYQEHEAHADKYLGHPHQDVVDRVVRERISDDFRRCFGEDQLQQRLQTPPERLPEVLASMAADVQSAPEMSAERRADAHTIRAAVSGLYRLPVGTRMTFSNQRPSGKWMPHWIAAPGGHWEVPDDVLASQAFAGALDDTCIEAEGASFDPESGEWTLVSTGVADQTSTRPQPAHQAEVAADQIEQMIRQDQVRGYVDDEPFGDLLAHVDQSVYTDEALDRLHIASTANADLPEQVWTILRARHADRDRL